MDDQDWLASRFEEHRGQLRAVAYRMLGSATEADDAVQETWIRLGRTDASEVENLGGWLTTVVGRVSLDMLRSRRSRREESWEERRVETAGPTPAAADPEQEALLADAVGPALLVVLETLAPAERLAFVLHDMFAVPFDEIGPIVGRSPAAARQLASRARRRVQGPTDPPSSAPGQPQRQRQIVDAFLAASRNGEFDALLALLDPEVVLRADPAAVAFGATAEVRGAAAVAETFSGRARAARPALVDGAPGLVWSRGGQPQMAFSFTVRDGIIVQIELLADPERLSQVEPVAAE
ncbi:MAG: sigma-70 family RNA polymerase sigma factor [Propionibacteriaceae bacterium]